MKLTPASRHILNTQSDKDAFINEAILFYSNSFLPKDERVLLQEKEISRLRVKLAASESYIAELEDKLSASKRPDAEPVESEKLRDKNDKIQALTAEVQRLNRLTKTEKLTISGNERIVNLNKQVDQQRETIKRQRQQIADCAARIVQLQRKVELTSTISS